MSFGLQQFVVRGLHKSKTLKIPIRDDRLVLVGVNGLGKTTIITLLYLILTRQWHRLVPFDFEELILEFHSKTINITHKAVELPQVSGRQLIHRFFPPSAAAAIDRDPELLSTLIRGRNDPEEIAELSSLLSVPPDHLRALANELLHSSGLAQTALFDEHRSPLSEAQAFIKTQLKAQVLYLPTYRRIEKDLKTIFPELDENLRNFNKHRPVSRRNKEPAYLELVEFGMEDVRHKFSRVIRDLRDARSIQLGALAGGYLSDVIGRRAHTYDKTAIAKLDDATIDRILDRVEEETLSEADRLYLRRIVQNIREGMQIELMDEFIAHFFSRLVEVHKALSDKERTITAFVTLCNEYLREKSIVFDDRTYEIRIRLDSGSEIQLPDLSSGEKQIVSLFSHLYLHAGRSFAVLIDEPELSLSVPWQKRLLPDIINAGKCVFLAAATHSPFIFDNSLEGAAVDLAERVIAS